MLKKKYVVMGATGNIGHVISQELIKYGHQVKVIGRNPKKLNILKIQGAELLPEINIQNNQSLTQAFKGADAVFTFIPPGYDQEDLALFQTSVADAIQVALKKNKINYVINLSSIGADIPDGTGPIKGLYYLEQLLNKIPKLNLIHLRPSAFMENLYWSIPSIKEKNLFYGAIREDLTIPMVATKDIGLKAAELLHRLNIKGQSIFEFGGSKDITYKEVAQVIGAAIDKSDLRYTQVSYEEAEQEMVNAHMPPKTASLIMELDRAINTQLFKVNPPLGLDHRGKTTIEKFMEDFNRQYKKISS